MTVTLKIRFVDEGAGRGKDSASRSATVADTTQQPPRELGFTGVSTHMRFTPLSTVKDFKPKDVISIGIERNIMGTCGNVVFVCIYGCP